MRSVTVLLTSAGVTTAVNVIHALRKSTAFKVKIVAVDMNKFSAGLYLADCHYSVPPASDPQYIDELLHICKKEDVHFLFPLFSGEIGLLARHAERFIQRSICLMLPHPEVIDTCIDKNRFLRYLHENSYPYPDLFLPDQATKESFPLFMKPVRGSSSKDTFIIRDQNELHFYLKKYPKSILQKYIHGVEYTVDCLVHHGKVYVCSPRARLRVKDGKSVVGKTVYHPELIELVSDLVVKIGMNGPCNVQCIEDEAGKLYLVEMNPRLAAGGLPLTVKAGANIPEMMLKLALGFEVNPVKCILPDIVMIRYFDDLFLQADENKELKRI